MMRVPWSILLPGVALLLFAAGTWYWQTGGGGPPPGLLQPSNAGVVARGETLYREHCASCHGADLEGQANWRERKADGRLPAPPHDETGHTWHHPDHMLLQITALGTAAFAGGGYQSDMPGYREVLSDQEILAILSFIKSTWPEEIRQRHDQISARAAPQ